MTILKADKNEQIDVTLKFKTGGRNDPYEKKAVVQKVFST